MGIDLTGGLDPSREFVFAEQPEEPAMRESVNVWVWDDDGRFGIPRLAIEALADQWETHQVLGTVVSADGRGWWLGGDGEVHDPRGADGRPRVLGAGPLSFALVEPFRHWRMRYDGPAVDHPVADQIAGRPPRGAATVRLRIELDLHSVAPPWENGALLPEAARVLAEQEEGVLVGGPRYEQLFRTTGHVEVDGRVHGLRGGGLRIRRQGVRDLAAGFWGHFWQSASFPSGRAFGCLVYPPREDGKPTYNEGFLFDGTGDLVPARVVEATWLRRKVARGEAVRVVLETTEGRRATVTGRTVVSSFLPVPDIGGRPFPVLQQATVEYTWDGEVGGGMMERSTMPAQMDR